METKIIRAKARFAFRSQTLEEWESENPVLLAGEHGVVTEGRTASHTEKIGDGVTAWNDLMWWTGGGGGGTSDYEELDNLPQVNGETLIGNKLAKDLNLPTYEYLQENATLDDIIDNGTYRLEKEKVYYNLPEELKDAENVLQNHAMLEVFTDPQSEYRVVQKLTVIKQSSPNVADKENGIVYQRASHKETGNVRLFSGWTKVYFDYFQDKFAYTSKDGNKTVLSWLEDDKPIVFKGGMFKVRKYTGSSYTDSNIVGATELATELAKKQNTLNAYIKSASVNGNTLTLTDKDDTPITFTPQGGGGSTIYRHLITATQTDTSRFFKFVLYSTSAEVIDSSLKFSAIQNQVSLSATQNSSDKYPVLGVSWNFSTSSGKGNIYFYSAKSITINETTFNEAHGGVVNQSQLTFSDVVEEL